MQEWQICTGNEDTCIAMATYGAIAEFSNSQETQDSVG